MLQRKSVLTTILMVTALVIVGCAKPPQEAIQAAEAALQSAETAQAATYATTELEAATTAMNAARQEIETQNGKFALTRSYKKAAELLADAKAKAEAAATAAVAGKQAAHEAAEAALATARENLEAAQTLLTTLPTCPRKPKGFAADLEALKGRADGFATTLDGIGEAIAQEDFATARADAEAVGAEISALVTDLESARAKIGC